MARLAKIESLQEIIAEMSEPADNSLESDRGESVYFLCHADRMVSKHRKEKTTEWNVGQPLTFPVIRPRIQRAANEAMDEAIKGPFQGKLSKRKKK
jgi:hypothetical protein